jgi:hypothetical protein
MSDKLKQWIDFVDENNLHIALAVGGVTIAIVAHVLGVLKLEGLVDTSLILLVVITVGLVYDRRARRASETTIVASNAALQATVDRAATDVVGTVDTLTEQVGRLQQFDHYRVVSSELTWDITDGGATAKTGSPRRLGVT